MSQDPKAADLLALALRTPRSGFIVACPYPLLLGGGGLSRPDGPQATLVGDRDSTIRMRVVPEAPRSAPAAERILIAIRKVQSSFPSMITVGRTANNDLTIPDIEISKFHAYFRLVAGRPDRVELIDAGSRNGTWVGDHRLPPKGAPAQVVLGDTVRFGSLAFTLVSAAGAWDLLHDASDW
jgi:FHA domain